MLPLEKPTVSQSKAKVFLAVAEKHGLKGWALYWQSLKGFLHGQISKQELEQSVFTYLGEEKLHLHDELIHEILSKINMQFEA
jgi:hypothetical protein